MLYISQPWLYICFASFRSFLSLVVDSLLASGATSKSKFDVHKIVTGSDEFTAKNIVVQAHAFTESARSAIEANGGKCQLLKHTTNEVLEEVVAA